MLFHIGRLFKEVGVLFANHIYLLTISNLPCNLEAV
jgi:hypothetical protein